MENLKNILERLQEITSENGLVNLTDDCLLEQAVKIYLSEKIQESKKENIREMKKPDQSATEKQIFILKKYKIPIPKDLTKKEASLLIDESLRKNINKGELL